jgi:hypothetical protein
MAVIGFTVACSLPLKFDEYMKQRKILRNGTIWAYKILGSNAWYTKRTKMARRFTRYEILTNPFRIKPWLKLFIYSTWSLLKRNINKAP